ncbi:cation:proton antiporter [[Phormidium] sp. ETS-05]|uniref:cation:proton antiporter n=1 Tax=[Phormidium] sp. ETS-05 TaxID=222819 RepID=UPI0018EF06D6|nr:cation:proton antiporter [[Phormidium] sp. ETS-05]
MNWITIGFIFLPFFTGFIVFIIPKIDRYLALGTALATFAYGLYLFTQPRLDLKLLDNFGVTLLVDELSGYFILTNALVTAAVTLYCWQTGKTPFFYGQMVILHGSLNAAFVCTDFMSLYVALEVSGIAGSLLVAYPRSERSIWVALRYLFVSNIAMLFYLVGAALVYQANHSFSFDGLRDAPPEAMALIFMALLTKGGVFVSGLWLPMTHSESESPVSAMLSGVVVKAGVFPLVRCALIFDEVDPVIRLFGMGTAVLGVSYAMWATDTKRLLAFSTVSQLGWILSAPEVAGFYTLTHGLVKSSLFMLAGALPSRNFKELQNKPIDTSLWLALVIAAFSISGFPLLSGFGAKVLTLKNLLPWQDLTMNLVAVGTAISLAKFIFLPHKTLEEPKPLKLGFWLGVLLLLGSLIVANVVYYEAYNLLNIIKALAVIGGGWLAYWVVFRRTAIKLPRVFEQFDDLLGVMTVISILLFWVAVSSGWS